MRPSFDEYYLNIAKAVAQRSTCLRRKYGAVIVNSDNKIVSTGYNGSPVGDINCCDVGVCERMHLPHNCGDYSLCKAIHAEMNACMNASKEEMKDATLYLYGEENGQTLTCEPCPLCSKIIRNSGIKKVICSKATSTTF